MHRKKPHSPHVTVSLGDVGLGPEHNFGSSARAYINTYSCSLNFDVLPEMSAATQYRHILREIYKASRSPRATRNPVIANGFRKIFEALKSEEQASSFRTDMENAIVFMRSQRIHKELLERYNPLFDLTEEERIKATARRVGLDMPATPEKE